MQAVNEPDILRLNLIRLTSQDFFETMLGESVGGNAGEACLAVNFEVRPNGRIRYIGNDPTRTNATVRIYMPNFQPGQTKLKETIIDVFGDIPEVSRSRLLKSIWLWNLRRVKTEREFVERFKDGDLTFEGLVEMVRTKYPWLAEALEKQPGGPADPSDAS